ncbi:MAG: TGS domain-containing protein [Nitrospinota bacterium]|nr:MAG: TGS domain-containing protein [Nitrospinota bacterium]
MPANLPPQYFEEEKALRAAKTPAEKIEVLERMLAVIPHHKGTDKLIAQIRRRIAKLKVEAQKKRGGSRHKDVYTLRREGAGQVAMVGLPNTGKSTLLAHLTHATPEIADYPCTTRIPLPGMMRFENVQVQLIDTPPLQDEMTEAGLFHLFRQADAWLLVLDLLDEPVLQVALIEEELARHKLYLSSPDDASQGRDKGEQPAGRVSKPTLLVGNKLDLPGAVAEYERLLQEYGARFPAVAISAQAGTGLDALRQAVYRLLGVIRVYTKSPGKKPNFAEPVILKAGSTVADLAASIHTEFLARLKFARIWGEGRFDGQKVARDHPLREGDIVEMHV